MKQVKNHMSKKKFRIGELSKALDVKKFVIRFWEKEFDLKSDRSEGGQRYYTQDDFTAFSTIKNLLYSQGYTIAGAKIQLEKILKDERPQVTAAVKTVEKAVPYIPKDFLDKVSILKRQLFDLKQKL